MDSSAFALAFKGSVAEAIAEAKAKNEILLVYVSEDYTNPEKLLARIQKAWNDVHSQEAASAVLTADLVSNKSEELSSSTSNASELLKTSSEIADMPSLLNNGLTEGEKSTKWSGSASSKEECRYEAERNDKSKGVPSSGMARDAQEDCFAEENDMRSRENITD